MAPASKQWIFQCNSVESCNSNKILTAKERKEHIDKNLWRFFFAICAFFVVNSSSVAAYRAGPLAAVCGKSIQVPVHELLTRHTALSKSCPVKPCQTQSNHFFTLTNLDHAKPPRPVRSGIKSGSPQTCAVQGAREFVEIRGRKPPLHSSTPSLHHSTAPVGVRGSPLLFNKIKVDFNKIKYKMKP